MVQATVSQAADGAALLAVDGDQRGHVEQAEKVNASPCAQRNRKPSTTCAAINT